MNKIAHLFHLAKISDQNGISLRKRLLIYLFTMSLAILAVVMTILIATGTIFNGKGKVNDRLSLELDHVNVSVQDMMDLLTAYGHQMSTNVAKSIDYCLDGETSILALNNNPDALLNVQRELYPELLATTKLARGSGSFAILNATTNTTISDKNFSRSGVYVRLSNVSSSVSFNPDVYLYRGIAALAREKEIELHNRWNLEVDLTDMPMFIGMISSGSTQGYWCDKVHIQNTWEDAILYCEPIVGKQGQIYGICGVEMSGLLMQLSYPAIDTDFGSVIVVMAPLKDGKLDTGSGLIGGQGGNWIGNHFPLLEIKEKGGVTYYTEGAETFVGMHKELTLAGENGTVWVTAVLTPASTYHDYVDKSRTRLIIIGLSLAAFMFLLCIGISKQYVDPIVKSIDSIQTEAIDSQMTGISELDKLLSFFQTMPKAAQVDEADLPPDIEELFEHFLEGVRSLTNAEYHIFHLYMEGYTIADVPTVACISMSTVKKHNRNIYDKLNISSNDELMLYIDLFKRSDRLSALEM